MVKVIPQINRERLHYVCYNNKQDKTFVTWRHLSFLYCLQKWTSQF